MVEPDFANPLIEKLKCFNWANYNEQIIHSRESELIIRSLEKKSYHKPVDAIQIIESRVIF